MAYSPSRPILLVPWALVIAASACFPDARALSSTGSGGAVAPTIHAGPPSAGPMMPPDGVGTSTFAISNIALGIVDLDGNLDTVSGWKHLGFDLDDRISTAESTDLCKPRNNASVEKVYLDGDNGADNAFGHSSLPILRGLASDFPEKVNEAITTGDTTLMFDLEKLGAGSDYNPILGRLYGGAARGKAPVFDGSDVWPVRSDLLANPADITSAKVRFPDSYLVHGTWVGRADGDIPLVLYGPSFRVHLSIMRAVVAMDLNPSHDGALHGTIAGIVSPAALVAEANRIGVSIDPSLCGKEPLRQIDSQVEQAADILLDGSQDPAKTCDGVSIGLGFQARRVKLGAPTAPDPADLAAPDPCL